MDEQLQSKIALALDKMINGAPEAWQALIAEVQLRATVMSGICVIAFILGLTLIRHSIKLDKWDDVSIAYVIPGMLITFISVIAALNNIYDLLAPSLALLNTLK